jgi:hypothetical protein
MIEKLLFKAILRDLLRHIIPHRDGYYGIGHNHLYKYKDHHLFPILKHCIYREMKKMEKGFNGCTDFSIEVNYRPHRIAELVYWPAGDHGILIVQLDEQEEKDIRDRYSSDDVYNGPRK